MKKLLPLLLALIMVFTLAACSAKTSFTVVTTDLDGKETTHEIKTDAATVGEALIEEGLLKGHTTEYGLYVDEVNGIALDWEKDGKYWAFYINGEYAQTGVDATNVEDGAVYTFKPE
ncbi:MAG: DUF4430 domain-containing protein [Oscillospiraceae bacterium]|nr:DUF4430 domain-containing protein [Oscillospiraceae bacterium]MBR4058174.1 DUF4430 domain-containing protein [Oscillospiraceae bacterium]